MRTVNIELDLIPGVPAANRRVRFRPVKKGQTSSTSVWPAEAYAVTTDANGQATVQLPTNIEIEVTLPDGWRGVFVVPPGATPVTLASLLASTAAPNLSQALIDAHAGLIAGVGASGTLGHVRVDGSTITINPSTGVISATGGGGGAPTGASYVTASADTTLTDERVATNTSSIEWDFSTPGQARLNLADNAVTTPKIATGAVTTPKIASNAVTVVELADDAVTTPKIANNAITTGKVASNAITTGKLDTGAVTTPKIADNAVTYAKLQDVSADRLLGREGTPGDVQEIAIGTGLSLSGGVLSSTVSSGAPVGAEYIVATPDTALTAERTATSTATVAWDFSTPGQAQAFVPDDAITSAKLSNGAVTTAKIADDAVTTVKLANSAVSYAKIQDVAANRLLGREGTAGAVQEIQIGTNLTLSGGVLSASGGATNLGYIASPTDGTVTSDTGADATLPLATSTDAGLLSPVGKQKLDRYDYATATRRLVLGGTSLPSGSDSMAIGIDATTGSAGGATAVGSQAEASANGSTAMGHYARTLGIESVAIGSDSRADANCTAVGYGARSFGHSACVLIGNDATATGPRQGVWSWTRGIAATGEHYTIYGQLATSTFALRQVGGIRFQFVDNTTATFRARLDIIARDVSGDRTGFTVESDGSQPLVSVYGATPTARPTAPADPTDLASALTVIAAIIDRLQEFGIYQ